MEIKLTIRQDGELDVHETVTLPYSIPFFEQVTGAGVLCVITHNANGICYGYRVTYYSNPPIRMPVGFMTSDSKNHARNIEELLKHTQRMFSPIGEPA